MAEKINIFELEIGTDKLIKNLAESRKKTQELKNEIKELSKDEKANAEAIEKKRIELQLEQKSLRDTQKQTRNLITANEDGEKTLRKVAAANATLREEQKDLNLATDEGVARNEELNEQINANTEFLKENSDENVKNKINVGNYTNSIIDALKILREQETQQKKNLLALNQATKAIDITQEEQEVLNKEIEKSEAALKDTNKELKKYGQNLDVTDSEIVDVTESSDTMMDSFSQLGGPVGQAANSIKAFSTASKLALGPIGLVVGAITLIVASLKEFFTSSEDGQNALKRLQAIFDVVFGNISDILSDVGKELFGFFQNPLDAIKRFASAIKENVTNRFEGILELVPKLGKSISLLFEGEFAKAAKTAGDAMAKVVLGVEDFSKKSIKGFNDAKNALSGFIGEQEREIIIAQKLADQQANVNKQIRSSNVANARDQQKIAEIRNKAAQKENFTALERLKLLDEAIVLENKILKRNENIAAQKLNIKKAQDNLSKSTKEDLDEESQLLVDLINVRTANAEKTRKLESERLSAIREINKEAETLRKNADADELADFEAELAKEEELLNAQVEKTLERAQAVKEGAKQIRDEEAQAKAIDRANEFELAQSNQFELFELQRAALEEKEAIEIAAAEKLGANVLLVEEKYSKAKKELNRLELQGKLSLAQDFSKNIATIAGKNSKVGKAAAASAATISAIQGATGAFASLSPIPIVGPALGAVAAAAALVSGFANVKKIYSTKSGLPGDSGGVAPPPSGAIPSTSSSLPTTPPVAAEVGQGIVSRDSETSQQVSETRTVLVLEEVTAAQELQSENQQTEIS